MVVRLALIALFAFQMFALDTSGAARADESKTLDLATKLDSLLSQTEGLLSVVVLDPGADFAYRWNERQPFEMASLFKLAVLVEAYRRASLDPAFFALTVPVARPSVASGVVVTEYAPMRVPEALERMITWSENSPAYALAQACGAQRIERTLRDLGLRDTALGAFREPAASNVTSAEDVAELLLAMLDGRVVSPDASAEMLLLLGRQHVNDRLSRGMRASARFAHKTGNSAGVIHDAGVAWTSFGPRVVVVLTSGVEAPTAYALMRDIGQAVDTLPAPSPLTTHLAEGWAAAGR